jgi:heme-degrading monooxygenase HmoA
MFVHLAIHHPHPDKSDLLIESMHRFAAAMAGQPGLQQVYTLRDPESGTLFGFAIWDSKDDWLAARPAMQAAVKDDLFDEWEDTSPEVYHMEPV